MGQGGTSPRGGARREGGGGGGGGAGAPPPAGGGGGGAIAYSNVDAAVELIQRGIDVNAQDRKEQRH